MIHRSCGSTKMGFYDNLNEGDSPRGTFTVTIGMDELAEKIDKLNYGSHRFLSALARRRLKGDPNDPLGNALKDALDKGMY